MCGRYRLTSKERYIRDHFNLDDDPSWAPHWNIAPTQQVAVVIHDSQQSKRNFGLMSWGLIPYWAKEPSIAFKTVNAKCESAADKPAFRDAFKWRRCLVPADGFYEWMNMGSGQKQPYNFGMKNDSLFSMAGLWERWKKPSGDIIQTCTILTTTANSLVAEVHDRMPVILASENYDIWLAPDVTDLIRISDYLKPFDPNLMKKYPVSSRVNRAENDDSECAREVPPMMITPTLF